jgi:hypothetical protein
MENAIQTIRALFPLKGKITKEIIEKSDVKSIFKCIGANTLRAALGDNINLLLEGKPISWGRTTGSVHFDDFSIAIGNEGDIDLMEVRNELEVVFTIL